MSVLKREKAKPCVLTWKESLREANPLETLSLWLVEDIEKEIKAKSWNKNGDVCNYSLNNDLLFLRMSLFFFLTAAAISWHSWSSFFCKFLFFGWLISFGFFSLAMQQKSSFFVSFFWLRKRDLHFLKKKLSNTGRV